MNEIIKAQIGSEDYQKAMNEYAERVRKPYHLDEITVCVTEQQFVAEARRLVSAINELVARAKVIQGIVTTLSTDHDPRDGETGRLHLEMVRKLT